MQDRRQEPESWPSGGGPSSTRDKRDHPTSVFVGREREMGELLSALDDAHSGRGQLVLLSGEPGIGKSRLADEVGEEARSRGARVLWGRCWEAGGAPAYWPWVQSIRTYLRDLDPDTLRDQVGSGAADIGQMLPEIRENLDNVPPQPSVDAETARFRLFDATTSFLIRAAGAGPLVLVLDDLHAADTPSLLLLQFLGGELAEAPILVVGTYRDTDLTHEHPLPATVAELVRLPATRHLHLGGLAEADVARFVELTTGQAPPASLANLVHSETEGNPLFVGEVVRLLAAEGVLERPTDAVSWKLTVPRGVREVMARRLSRLSPESNQLLTLASIFGREFDLGALEQMSGLSRRALLEVLEEANAAGVITDVPGALGQMRFSHALVRDTLYENLAVSGRLRLHREAGEALEGIYRDDPDPHLAELAHHFVQAAPGGEAEKAVDYARRAAERAVSLLAYEEAVRLYGMALQALELVTARSRDTRCELLLALGDAQARAGDEPNAKGAFLEAARIAERLEHPEYLARAALGFGGRFVWARAGTDRNIVLLLEKALASLGQADSTLRARVMARLAGALRDQGSREPRASLSHEALEMARRLGDPATLTYALDGRCAVLLWPENPQERINVASDLVRVAEEIGDLEKAIQGRYYRLMALLELGDVHDVNAELATIEELAGELNQRPQLWLVAVTRATLALLEGRLDDAEELIPQALAIGERAQESDAVLSYRIQLFTLKRDRGGLEDHEATIRQSIEDYPARPMFRCMLALLYGETGRPNEARKVLERLAVGDFGTLPPSNEWIFSMSMLSEVTELLGDDQRAETMYDLLLPYAPYTGATADYICTGSVSRYLGLLASVRSRWEEAERHFDDALERNASMGARPWVARSRYDHGRMLLARDASGDRERATDLLTAALEACRALGMAPLERRVEALLEEYGEEVSARDSPAPVAPMESEAPVAERRGLLRREGEYWSISYHTDSFRLRDVKGLRYLARLLAEPGREFHVLDLVAAERGHGRGKNVDGEPGLEIGGLGDAGAVLDPTAKAAYRRRLDDLEQEVEDARALGDAGRATRAEEERDLIARELARAMGVGGRDRKTGSPAERARVSVTQAIRAALAKIGHHSLELGRHLDWSIRTGTYCSYQPDPSAAVSWRF